jgi:hypothetical protein
MVSITTPGRDPEHCDAKGIDANRIVYSKQVAGAWSYQISCFLATGSVTLNGGYARTAALGSCHDEYHHIAMHRDGASTARS